MQLLALFVVLLSACGRLGFDPRSGDAATGDAALSPADLDLALGPWSAPMSMTDLNAPGDPDDDPSLTGDLLEVFWDSGRPPGSSGDVFTARRTSALVPFGAASIVTELRSPTDDTTPDVSPDGLSLYFASDRAVSLDRDIYLSTRADRASPWSVPVRIPELASPQDDGSAIETADGLNLFFSSERTGAGDIYVATRAVRGQAWSVPVTVSGVNTAAQEDQFWIDPTGTLLYFTTRDPVNGNDMWRASRASLSDPFGDLMPISEVNTPSGDSDPWLSPDLQTLVFASDRDGVFDLYITTR